MYHTKNELSFVCTYLIQADLVKRLATARVITHLIRDGIFQTIRVTDPTLSAEALCEHTCTDVEGHISDSEQLFHLSHERT